MSNLPQVFWGDGLPWREANLWFFDRARSRDISIKTVASNAVAISAYATWLESSGTNWWDFPQRKADRCLVKYRGALVRARTAGQLSPSTASARMRAVIAFYRWLYYVGLLSPDWPMWEEKVIGIHLENSFGLQRTINVQTTDLSIPNRSRGGSGLEDGLMPVSSALRVDILDLAERTASEELKLMLSLGFFTGLRIGSICDLKVATLENAVPDPSEPGIYWLSVGPSAQPPVATKFDVPGQVIIPAALLDVLKEYAFSQRRLKREALAAPGNKDILFLSRYGNPYVKTGSDQSSSINAEMHRLRKAGVSEGIPINEFKFHQSRATFATSVAELALKVGGSINAVGLVKDLLLHKDEATSLKYIRFVEKAPVKAELANEFSKEFMGVLTRAADAGA